MGATTNRDLTTDLRDALIEAKESMEGKRKLNTLERLIVELKEDSKPQGEMLHGISFSLNNV